MGSTLDASATVPRDHVVLFYEQDRFLSECIASYARQGLAEDRDVLVVATAPHRRAVDALLDRSPRLAGTGARLTTLDARDTLDSLLVDGVVDTDRLHDLITPWLAASNRSGRAPRIYGEMVALLWRDGRFEPALELEGLWNRLGETFSFSLLCGYPLRDFSDQNSAASFLGVCQQHTAVTMESYARLRGDHDDAVPMVVLHGGSPGGRIELN
jgi:hypothetical protein